MSRISYHLLIIPTIYLIDFIVFFCLIINFQATSQCVRHNRIKTMTPITMDGVIVCQKDQSIAQDTICAYLVGSQTNRWSHLLIFY